LPKRQFRFIHRDIIILLGLCALAVVAFLVTRDSAASNRELFLRDAAVWYETGLRAFDESNSNESIQALRRATAMSGGNQEYQLALARALALSGQDDVARAELLALRELSPEDPEINIELARLEARGSGFETAVRYYESALYGFWPAEQAEMRSRLRVELIRYLLDYEQKSTALSEILALTENMSDTISWQIEAAELFMEADDAARALDRLILVLETEPDNGSALAGAGRAAFALDDYASASRFLAEAPTTLPDVLEFRVMSDFVLTRNPLAARLSTEQRRQRLIANMTRAHERLTECAEDVTVNSDLALAQKAVRDFEFLLEPQPFRDSSDVVETGVDIVYRVQLAAARACRAPTDLDRALEIIGRLNSSESQ
jgi:tetratricopeptide (TPR) repeat protein